MGLAVGARISISNFGAWQEAFRIPGANSCIDCEPHKGWPRDPDSQWIGSIRGIHWIAFSAISMAVFFKS